jgi:hypothetical protein
MTKNSLDPARIISILEILLAQLEASLAPHLAEGDSRSDNLKIQISGYKEKAARLKSVLSKHQAAQRRKQFLKKQNKENR